MGNSEQNPKKLPFYSRDNLIFNIFIVIINIAEVEVATGDSGNPPSSSIIFAARLGLTGHRLRLGLRLWLLRLWLYGSVPFAGWDHAAKNYKVATVACHVNVDLNLKKVISFLISA